MIKSKSELVSAINSELADNSAGAISPRDIRHNLIDIIDSVNNLLTDQEVNTLNFGTPDHTSVRFGEQSLSKLNLAGYSTSGNTAIGYAALQNNYQAVRNTAIGSYSLNCNVHGYDNVGAGYSSLAGNTIGFGNVGLGCYALNNNKLGDFNIAIGHGAGYYADRDTNNKLYIGSHNVDSSYICANPNGSGLVPLIYGDMSCNIVAINAKDVHPYGVLQTSGSITPSKNKIYDLGHTIYKWRNVISQDVYCSSVKFENNNQLITDANGILLSGNLLPFSHNSGNIGSNFQRFNNIYVRSIFADSGIISTTTNYVDKTLYLASSGTGPFIGYLDESGVLDAGLVVRVSGITDPSFIYDFTENTCGETFRRWKSNIGIELVSGEFLRATSFIAPSSCVGLHFHSGQLFNTTKDIFDNSIFDIAGTGNVNFIKDSGNADTEYIISYISQESGIDISQRFLYRADGRTLENGSDKLSGFILKAFDEYGSDLSYGSNLDRFSISSFDNSSSATNSIILMKNNESGGVFGINNFLGGDNTLAIPKTIFNVRSATNATARITSETAGDTQTSLQLMGECNDLADGLELQFSRINHFSDINIYQNSGLTNFVRMEPSGSSHTDHRVGILNSSNINSMFTIGASGNDSVAISMYSNPSNESSTVNYGKIYVNDKLKESQSHTLKFIDGSGNIFDLVQNSCDSGTTSVFSQYNNTVLGIGSVTQRCNISPQTSGNTVFGDNCLPILNSGFNNTIIGHSLASSITNGSKNIVIGYNSLNNTNQSIANSIIIGNSVGSGSISSNTFLIGQTYPLMSGNLNSLDVFIPNGDLTIEKSNRLILSHVDGKDKSIFRNDAVTIYDSGTEFPEQNYTFEFMGSGNAVNDLLILDHSVSGMVNDRNYFTPTPARPFAELRGDLKLQGDIRFSNGYSLQGGSLEYVSGISTNNSLILNSIFVEGYASGDIDFATDYNSPSSGLLLMYNSLNTKYTIVNRDKYTKIKANDFVVAIKINNEYRPIWVSNESSVCNCCVK